MRASVGRLTLGRRLVESFAGGRDLYLPDGRWGFARRYLAWQWRSRFGTVQRLAGPERFTAIVLSFRRPENIGPIARSVLRCAFVERLVVCNNNPDERLADWLTLRDARLRAIDREDNGGTLVRLTLARDLPARYFLVLDDDLFLDPAQIRRVAEALVREPDRAHGIYGQIANADGGFHDAIHGIEREVEILNRVFAFTDEHVREFFELHRALAIDTDESPLKRTAADDILLSRCGRGRPRCHDVGPLLDCPTEGVAGIAVWRESDFSTYRSRLYERLGRLKSFG